MVFNKRRVKNTNCLSALLENSKQLGGFRKILQGSWDSCLWHKLSFEEINRSLFSGPLNMKSRSDNT